MPYVACPSCGERGKITPSLLGARIKCRKCGISFNVAPPAAKARDVAPGHPEARMEAPVAAVRGSAHEGIAVEGLDASAWSVVGDQSGILKDEAAVAVAVAVAEPESSEPSAAAENASSFAAQARNESAFKEYKLLTSRDKIFENKFDLPRLEEALNYYARQGWVVKTMSTPHIKGFSGGPQEEIVILLER